MKKITYCRVAEGGGGYFLFVRVYVYAAMHAVNRRTLHLEMRKAKLVPILMVTGTLIFQSYNSILRKITAKLLQLNLLCCS